MSKKKTNFLMDATSQLYDYIIRTFTKETKFVLMHRETLKILL